MDRPKKLGRGDPATKFICQQSKTAKVVVNNLMSFGLLYRFHSFDITPGILHVHFRKGVKIARRSFDHNQGASGILTRPASYNNASPAKVAASEF